MTSLFGVIERYFPAGTGFQPEADSWINYCRFAEEFAPDAVSESRQEIEFRARGVTDKKEDVATLEVEFRLSAERCRYLMESLAKIAEELDGRATRVIYYMYKPWPEEEEPFWLRDLASSSGYMVWAEELRGDEINICAFRDKIMLETPDFFYSGALEVRFLHIDVGAEPGVSVPGSAGYTADHKTVLLVDDNEATLRLLQMILETSFEEGRLSFIPCSRSTEVVDLAVEHQPHLILLDIMMPKKDGLEVLKELKENDQTEHIPVVMVSVLSDDEARGRAKKLGAARYLTKPFVPYDITQVIQDMLFQEPA